MRPRSINGGLTRPLTKRARGDLWILDGASRPRCEFNPGVVDRLTRADLAEEVELPRPYKAHKGGTCPHLQITEKGRAALRGGPDGSEVKS